MAYEYTTPRNKIIYDKEKCGNAYECFKCVEITLGLADIIALPYPRVAEGRVTILSISHQHAMRRVADVAYELENLGTRLVEEPVVSANS